MFVLCKKSFFSVEGKVQNSFDSESVKYFMLTLLSQQNI